MIIDVSSKPPIPAFSPSRKSTFMARYRSVYEAAEAAAEGAKDGPDAMRQYLEMYDGVDARFVVVKAKDSETTTGVKIENEGVAEFCRTYGPRFVGFAGVDPHKGMAAVRELEFAVKELGLKGLNLQPFENKLSINDKRLYPIYAKCIELDIPLNVHCSINFSTESSMEHGRPILLDEVLMHFPELRVAASTSGWPWVHELVGVAWRHKNLHINLSAVRPKYLAVPGSGYEGLLQYGNTVLQDRMMFGTSYPLMPVGRAVEEVKALPLKDKVVEKWLYGNAQRFLRLG